MRIETVTNPGSPTKVKGDLLEDLAGKLLKAQNYEVAKEVRVTATELDLLCRHRVNHRQIYVECKAYRDTLSANVLTNLLGTITFKGYQEGWLICAGPLGKDAKGFRQEWEAKQSEDRHKLSIYTPDRVVEALATSNVIKDTPVEAAVELVGSEDALGEWILLISEYGYFWAAIVLQSGIPTGVVVFSATSGGLVSDGALLKNLAGTDTSLKNLNFEFLSTATASPPQSLPPLREGKVVEVQHGESWADYRPARPQDFVGRSDVQNRIVQFFESVRVKSTGTRVFAITGDSGMGKSSLVAKLREKTSNIRHRKKFFLYAVDVRAATSSDYILWSLLACIRAASLSGFGTNDSESIKITDYNQPLASETIRDFLDRLEQQERVVILVFDQFEELYSKPELFAVFEEAQRLFLSAAQAASNLVLGFAWKTDSTVQQDHPAYYMWHRLSDHRLEVRLAPFTVSERTTAITLFERELGEKVRPELRRQIIENSQGYPWLLKKLCIHLYEQVQAGISQAGLAETFDVASLFDNDLKSLTPGENACLKMIAQTAPADWFEILEAYGHEVLRALQDKRLIVRSGDRINLYWDIFREYVLTKNVPSIPFTYLPSSPSLKSLLAVAMELRQDHAISYADIGDTIGLGEKTVGNIVRDLVMFSVATSVQSAARLDGNMDSSDLRAVMDRIRHVLKRHALTLRLAKFDTKTVITTDDLVAILKENHPSAKHRPESWRTYADRMALWLSAAGLIKSATNGWVRDDRGGVQLTGLEDMRKGGYRRSRGPFTAEAPPRAAYDAYVWLTTNQPATADQAKQAGHRNSMRLLGRLSLAQSDADGLYIVANPDLTGRMLVEAIWTAAKGESAIQDCIEFLKDNPTTKGPQLGRYLNEKYGEGWAEGSEKRVGTSMRTWARWVARGIDEDTIPDHNCPAKAFGV